MQNILTQYAELKLQEKQIKAQLDELQPAVLALVEKEQEAITHPLGKFILVSRASWKYSPVVTKLSEKLKIKQIEEQEKGIAQASISNSVTFNAIEL